MATRELLERIEKGMKVHDSTGTWIGTVDEVYFGTGSNEAEAYTSAPNRGHDSALNPDIADPFDAASNLPDPVRRRLLTHGYLRIDTTLLEDDRFVLAEQVADVADTGVHLNVPKDDLVR